MSCFLTHGVEQIATCAASDKRFRKKRIEAAAPRLRHYVLLGVGSISLLNLFTDITKMVNESVV